jgi:lysophospholipase L1-like esterase
MQKMNSQFLLLIMRRFAWYAGVWATVVGSHAESTDPVPPFLGPEPPPRRLLVSSDDVSWRNLAILPPHTPQTPPFGSDYLSLAEWRHETAQLPDRACHRPAVATLWLRRPAGQWKIQGPIPGKGHPSDLIKQDLQTQVSAIQEPTQKATDRPTAAHSGTFPDVARILFLGDSITYSGHYITLLETAIRLQYPQREVELLNLGLPSETVSGLSEPGHAGGQFPRPNLHERLSRVLDQVKPDLVVACYGMNDGIYHPLDEERFAAFRAGITQLREEVRRRDAEVLFLTPAMFDAQPIADRLLPMGLAAYPQPYENYDAVLQHYTAWLLTKRLDDWIVIDVHGAMRDALADRRQTDPNATFAADGVHPNDAGHAVIATALANHWGLNLADEQLQAREDIRLLIAKKQETLKHAWLTRTGHLRPGLPAGLDLDQAQAAAAKLRQEISARLGRE